MTSREKATKIVKDWCERYLELTTEHDCENGPALAMIRAIASAIDDERHVPSRNHHPYTKDGHPIFMGGCLYYLQEQDGTDTPRYVVTECGALSITDRDDRYWEDYGEGERWIIGIRDTDGIETEVSDADLFATREAALAARTTQPEEKGEKDA